MKLLINTCQLFGKIILPVYLFNMLFCIPLVTASFFLLPKTQFALASPYNFFAMIMIQIITIKAASSLIGNESFSWRNIFQGSLKKYKLMLLYSLLITLVCFVSAIFLVFPAVIISLMAMLAAPAIVIENLSIKEAWKRSRALTKGFRWQLFGYFIFIMLLSFVFYFGIGELSIFDEGVIDRQMLIVKILFRAIGFPINCLATVWITTFVTVTFYNRLSRREEKVALC